MVETQSIGLDRLAHAAARAADRFDPAEVDSTKLKRKIESFLRGLPAEDEFAAFCLWSRKCVLIHQLEQPGYGDKQGLRVPDFLCVFELNGRYVPTLIEVKSTKRKTLPFTRSYVKDLQNYATLVGLPMLLALKYTGWERSLWSLVELDVLKTLRGSYRANAFDLYKNDLKGLLMGEFSFDVYKGVSFCMDFTSVNFNTDKSFIGKVNEVYWRNESGNKINVKSAPLLFDLFGLFETDSEMTKTGPNSCTVLFRKTSDDSALAQWALPIAVGRRSKNLHRFLDKPKFKFTLEEMIRAIDELQKQELVNIVLYLRPHTMPEFLKTIVSPTPATPPGRPPPQARSGRRGRDRPTPT